ncbi:MAG: hypothetical protein AAFV53_33830 [Myxococcota bacterium]
MKRALFGALLVCLPVVVGSVLGRTDASPNTAGVPRAEAGVDIDADGSP